MSQSDDAHDMLQSLRESFAEAVEARARAGFPRPRVLEEWRSWLTHEACMNVYRGVQTGDAAMYRNVLTQLSALRAVIALGVAYDPAIPVFPAFLYEREEVSSGMYTSNALREGAGRAFREVLDQLDREIAIGLHIQEYCELAGLPNPSNMAQWIAVLINMGCVCICNTKSFLEDAASAKSRSEEARRRAETDVSEIDDALCVFRGVELLASYGVRPDPGVKMFPL